MLAAVLVIGSSQKCAGDHEGHDPARAYVHARSRDDEVCHLTRKTSRRSRSTATRKPASAGARIPSRTMRNACARTARRTGPSEGQMGTFNWGALLSFGLGLGTALLGVGALDDLADLGMAVYSGHGNTIPATVFIDYYADQQPTLMRVRSWLSAAGAGDQKAAVILARLACLE